MGRSFESLISEAEAADVEGWDFSWLDGRATEERPSWGYQRLLAGRLASATAALDLQTGGGEVIAGAGPETEAARAAGLEVVDCQNERLALQFFDVGAVVYFLRKVIWTVPKFSVNRYRTKLRDLHELIERDGVFHSTMSRTLFELRKPM